MGVDVVMSFCGLVARKAFLVCRFIGRLAVRKIGETPTARRGIFFRVLYHKLHIFRRPGNERLGAAEDFVIFFRWNVLPMYCRNDRAVRERNRSLAIGFDRDIVAQLGAQIVEIAFFVGYGDQLPIAVIRGGILTPKIGAASRLVRFAANVTRAMAQTAIAAIIKIELRFIHFLFAVFAVVGVAINQAKSPEPARPLGLGTRHP